MIREMADLPEHLRRSITWDRGSELADYRRIQLELDAGVLLRPALALAARHQREHQPAAADWLDQGHRLSRFSAADLRRIAASLNAPTPTLDMQTPAQGWTRC